MSERSKVVKFSDYRWEQVPLEDYKTGGKHFKDVTRQTLLGEGSGEGALHFVTRYFEIQPGGYSTLERHEHPHSVVVLRGRGSVLLGDEAYDLRPYDCVYCAPRSAHQFRAASDQPLGFLCAVDRIRDRPQVFDPASGEWITRG